MNKMTVDDQETYQRAFGGNNAMYQFKSPLDDPDPANWVCKVEEEIDSVTGKICRNMTMVHKDDLDVHNLVHSVDLPRTKAKKKRVR